MHFPIMKLGAIVVIFLAALSACASRVVLPPDQATLDACSHDCTEQWKNCQGKTCEQDRATCVDRCRNYGGLRGGGKGVAIEIPTSRPTR